MTQLAVSASTSGSSKSVRHAFAGQRPRPRSGGPRPARRSVPAAHSALGECERPGSLVNRAESQISRPAAPRRSEARRYRLAHRAMNLLGFVGAFPAWRRSVRLGPALQNPTMSGHLTALTPRVPKQPVWPRRARPIDRVRSERSEGSAPLCEQPAPDCDLQWAAQSVSTERSPRSTTPEPTAPDPQISACLAFGVGRNPALHPRVERIGRVLLGQDRPLILAKAATKPQAHSDARQ